MWTVLGQQWSVSCSSLVFQRYNLNTLLSFYPFLVSSNLLLLWFFLTLSPNFTTSDQRSSLYPHFRICPLEGKASVTSSLFLVQAQRVLLKWWKSLPPRALTTSGSHVVVGEKVQFDVVRAVIAEPSQSQPQTTLLLINLTFHFSGNLSCLPRTS